MRMLEEYYRGIPGIRREHPLKIPMPVLPRHGTGSYLPEPGLVRAVNVAFLMGQPLLVTGPPGCGKTALAYSIANEHSIEVHKVSVRSDTSLGDLFYEFDHLARFRDSQAGRERSLQSYLRFTGLGLAILKAGGPNAVVDVEEGGALVQAEGVANGPGDGAASGGGAADNHSRRMVFSDLLSGPFPVDVPTLSVVLVDEIDKAPRDTPNDMLGWLETMSFEVRELGITVRLPQQVDKFGNVEAEGYVAPIVVFTSNSEKSLPEPFLRRCVYYDIHLPDETKMVEIVCERIGKDHGSREFAKVAVSILMDLIGDAGIRRKPGVAEFLGWVVMLRERFGLQSGTSLRREEEILKDSLVALLKTPEDLEAGMRSLGLK